MKSALFESHITHLTKEVRGLLETNGFDALIIHAGTPSFYAADDQEVLFRTFPHFARFVPIQSTHHLLYASREKLQVSYVVQQDFWLEQGVEDTFWQDALDTTTVTTPEDAWKLFPVNARTAFLGDERACSEALMHGIAKENCNPEKLVEFLDALRAIKTEYEITCIKKANERAAAGHAAAREAFFEGKSEREIHFAYLQGAGVIENELPYPTIVALNEKASILHYQHKRAKPQGGNVLLLDAGARERGYASDITRTYVSPACNTRFTAMLSDLENLQKQLVAMVRPHVAFIEIHHEAHLGIAEILKKHEIIREDTETAIERGVTRVFFPHGVGHMLGIQVHDVGGHETQKTPHPLTALYPKIRTSKILEPGNVTTIEPGIYFNPVLLHKAREAHAASINWHAVDALVPYGGMRIEDNVLVTNGVPENLTRIFLA